MLHQTNFLLDFWKSVAQNMLSLPSSSFLGEWKKCFCQNSKQSDRLCCRGVCRCVGCLFSDSPPWTWFTRVIMGALGHAPTSGFAHIIITYGLCRTLLAHWALGQQRSELRQQLDASRCTPLKKRSKRKTCGENLGEWGENMSSGPGSSLLLVLSSVCVILPSSLQAAAEPVAAESVHTPLHSAWRPPARGLTFPEVLSHSASCYSLWQVGLYHSGRQQIWAEARRRGLFHTSHWSSLLEVPRSQGVYRRLSEVSITLLAQHAAPGDSQV